MIGAAWHPQRVVWVFEQLHTSTTPLIVQTLDGRALLKYLGNRRGPNALAMEWIGLHAARGMGLPVPDCAMVMMTPDQADIVPGLRPGPGLAIRHHQISAWNRDPRSIDPRTVVDFFATLCVVDTWLLNRDRYGDASDGDGEAHHNYPNVQVHTGRVDTGAPLAIDFSDAFHGGLALGRVPLSDLCGWPQVYGCFPEIRPVVPYQAIVTACERLGGGAWRAGCDAVASCPEAWWRVPLPRRQDAADLLRDRAQTLASHLPLLIARYITPPNRTIFDPP